MSTILQILGYSIIQLPEFVMLLLGVIKNKRSEYCNRIQQTKNNGQTLGNSNGDSIVVQVFQSNETETEIRIKKENYEWIAERFDQLESTLKFVIQKIDPPLENQC